MTLVRWNPWRESAALQNRINTLFDDVFFKSDPVDNELAKSHWVPAVDIYDNGDRIVIKSELPGVDKKDINIDLKDRVLTIKGERSFENDVNEGNYYRRERSWGTFQRSFNLPAFLDPEKVKADYKDGVLTVEIPKPEEEKPKQITIH